MKNRTIATLCGLLATLTLAHAVTLEVDKGRSRCDRTVRMRDGRIEGEPPPDQ